MQSIIRDSAGSQNQGARSVSFMEHYLTLFKRVGDGEDGQFGG
jgi:hypothetical protein